MLREKKIFRKIVIFKWTLKILSFFLNHLANEVGFFVRLATVRTVSGIDSQKIVFFNICYTNNYDYKLSISYLSYLI